MPSGHLWITFLTIVSLVGVPASLTHEPRMQSSTFGAVCREALKECGAHRKLNTPFADSKSYFDSSTAQQRRQFMESTHNDADLAGFFMLETHIDQLTAAEFKKKVAILATSDTPQSADVYPITHEWLSYSDKLNPWNVTTDRGYGISQESAWQTRIVSLYQQLNAVEARMDKAYQSKLPQEFNESVATQNNIAYLLQKVIFKR